MGSGDPPAASGEPHAGPDGRPKKKPVLEQAPGRSCGSMERGACAGASLLAGLVTPQGPTVNQPDPEGLHSMEKTHAGADHKELRQGLTLEKLVEDCLLWEASLAGVEQDCEESHP